MEKRKVYKISIIDKEISRTEFDRNTFYTSDSELTLVFKLIEKDYSYEHGEILLYNEDDESFVTRQITKKENDFVYELESDIIPHYGKWKAQLQLVNDGDVYTSKPFEFSIVNDLSNLAPQPTLTDINNWATLKNNAAELIDEMQDIIDIVEQDELERVNKENYRQKAEFNREKAELKRDYQENTRINSELKRVTQETKRVENETERQIAELKRQNVFNSNEDKRSRTFNTNEATRQENENKREQAENERVEAEYIRVENENKRQTEIENIKDIVYVNMKNLVNNSDVSKGLENWTSVTTQSTLSVENNDLKVTYLTKVDNLYINNTTQVAYNDNMYYSIVRFNPVNLTGTVRLRHNGEYRQSKSIGAQNEFQTISSVFNGSGVGNQIEFRVFALDTKAGDYFYIDYFMLLDLTEIFGAGNEPTKEVMDLVISENGYFDELTLKRYDLQQYEINQLRKAVIALGGTI